MLVILAAAGLARSNNIRLPKSKNIGGAKNPQAENQNVPGHLIVSPGHILVRTNDWELDEIKKASTCRHISKLARLRRSARAWSEI
jgi:hypothetical protein